MIKTRVAKRYARALFELAKEAGRIEEYGRDLEVVHTLFKAEEAVRQGLTSVVASHEEKAEVLDALIGAAGIDKLVGNFLKVLLAAGKMSVLPFVASEYRAMADEATGKLRGTVTSPLEIMPGEVEKMAEALSRALGKQVLLEARQDPALIGGVVARVGNLVYDASVRTQIQRMKESLIKG